MKKAKWIFFLCLPFFLWATEAFARPGGGHSYSGGGGGGGGYSGGGGGDGGGGELLLYLLFSVPEIGIPLIIVAIVLFFWMQSSQDSQQSWDSAQFIPTPPPDLSVIRRFDPDFSVVLFEDFVYQLFAEAHWARHDKARIAAFSPHLSENAQTQLIARCQGGKAVQRVVIGSMTANNITLPDIAAMADGRPYYVKISVRFESNIGDGDQALYVDETWHFARAANVISPEPGRMATTVCSNCGAPYQHNDRRVCQSCDEIVDSGRFGWLVTSTSVNQTRKAIQSLTGYAPEVGTQDLTRIHPNTVNELHGLQLDDPDFSESSFVGRAALVFENLYQAWNKDEISLARPYVSDNLYNYLHYWLDAYRQEGLSNLVANHAMTGYTIAKLARDRHYDAITIRIWAAGADYTTDKEGRVVGGSKNSTRYFSEYWTFIRRADHHGKTTLEKQCPNCGAQLKISMAGVCEYCEAHITSGEFDWVLSKIEQDESYHG